MNHNKNTNVSLVYQALLQIVAEAVITESTKSLRDASVAKKIIKNYFIPGTSLKNYIDISEAIINCKMIDEKKETAFRYLEEVESFIQSKRWKNYTKEKIDFLKETKKFFNLEELTNRSFPNYKLIASTHLFIESCIGEKSIHKLDDKVKICFTLIERLLNRDDFALRRSQLSDFLKENKIDKYTILLATNEFKKKLSNLKESHREIVSMFLVENDPIVLSRFLSTKIKNYLIELRKYFNEIEDKDLKEKISLVISNLSDYKNEVPKEKLEEIAEKLIDVIDLFDILKENIN